MYDVKITVLCRAEHKELQLKYENPISHACDVHIGQTFLSTDAHMPEGMCSAAWQSLQPFVFALANGGGDFYDGWMKNKYSACVSCNDGFRPVSYLLERVEK